MGECMGWIDETKRVWLNGWIGEVLGWIGWMNVYLEILD